MKKFTLIFIGIFSAFVSVEIYFRLFSPQLVFDTMIKDAMRCFRSDPDLYATLEPGSRCLAKSVEYDATAQINNMGFRAMRDTTIKKEKGVKRIVFIGDSFTFGQGVKDGEEFPSVIEKILTDKKYPVEIINAAIPGSGPDWYYLMMKNKILQFNPDVVVAGIFVGNDFLDIEYFQDLDIDSKGLPRRLKTDLEYVDSNGVRRYTADSPLFYRLPFFRNIHTFAFLHTLINGPSMLTAAGSLYNGTPCFLDPKCSEFDSSVDKATEYMVGMNTLAKERNISFIVAVIPWEMQLPRHLLERSGVGLVVTKRENRHAITDKIISKLKEKNIEYIDLLDAFEAYQGNEKVFYPQDRHWTAEGHRIAAQAISEKLLPLIIPNPLP